MIQSRPSMSLAPRAVQCSLLYQLAVNSKAGH